MSRFVDKSIFSIIALSIFGIHTALSFIAVLFTWSSNLKLFQIGFTMVGWLAIVYPIVGGFIYIIVSLIGMIKNKKVLPYLVCPVVSIFVWLILVGSVVAYG